MLNNHLPHLTKSLPGVGGVIKSVPEDFYVEEIPLYQPCGQGHHTYIWFEKVGLTTLKAIGLISQEIGVKRKDVGYAGLKDAQAVTRQTISIANVLPEQVQNLSIPGINILSAKRHKNKLRIGHLAGNKFVIRIRDITQDALPSVEIILKCLQAKGVPNYFGEQRFGVRRNSHLLGKALLQRNVDEFLAEFLGHPHEHELLAAQQARSAFDAGDWRQALKLFPHHLRDERMALNCLIKSTDAQAAIHAIDQRLKRLFVSAFQSDLFNQLLMKRLKTMHVLEIGDIAYLHKKGACFVVQDRQAEQARADAFEISPSGPLFGTKYLAAQAMPGEREAQILQRANIAPNDFKLSGMNFTGARRPYRVPLEEVSIHWDQGAVLSFILPSGGYATTVLREVMKNEET